MNIEYYFRNIEASDHLKDYARSRFDKLAKYISNTDNAEIQVNMSLERFRHKIEVVLVADNMHLSAYEESEDMYSTIDMVLDKLETQVKKLRDRTKDKKRSERRSSVRTETFTYGESGAGEGERTIVETDNYQPKPMSVDEAAMQLDSLKFEFLVFQNAESDRVNVIFRRKNGDFGLIDPGV